jgi:hypothetical protein
MNVTERYLEQMKAPHELNPDINMQVSSAVMLAMEMKPEDRFRNVAELREALNHKYVPKKEDINVQNEIIVEVPVTEKIKVEESKKVEPVRSENNSDKTEIHEDKSLKTTAPSKKSNMGLLLGGVAAVAAIVFIIVFFAMGSSEKAPEATEDLSDSTKTEAVTENASSDIKKSYNTIEPKVSTNIEFKKRYPFTSEKIIDERDLAGYSAEELRIMRNEIFARYCYKFKDEALNELFYKERQCAQINDVNPLLSQIEIKNVVTIAKVEQLKKRNK